MKKYLIFLFLVLVISCNNTDIENLELKNIDDSVNEVISMKLTSPAFEDMGRIPPEYTCEGEDISPEFNIEDIPKGTVSLALIMEDPDAPGGTWDHWIVFNIPVTSKIYKGEEPKGIAGKNSWGNLGYGGPCPPSGSHRYIFKLYALDVNIDLSKGVSKQELENKMQGHIIEEAKHTGLYEKS